MSTIRFEYGSKITPMWVYDWVESQAWIEAAQMEDRALRKCVPADEFQKAFSDLMYMKHNVNVFEYTDGMMYVNIPDTPETTAFVLKNQRLSE